MKIIYIIFSIYCYLFILNSTNSIAQSTPDPGIYGTLSVSKDYYNLGNLAFSPPTFPVAVEVIGSVHYPTLLSSGPYPVIFLMHGRHTTTYQTSNPSNTSLSWPPAIGYQSITSYEGYDTLARLMASHGYIVISISCNGINATDNSTPDRGMQARGELLQHHMDLWNTYNTTGSAPFGTRFIGKLNMNNIGTMGHSRGGEGVVYNALYNRSLGSPYGIKAVITLAPVDFYRQVLNDIPLLNIAPYCDGDVTGLSGVRYYDDARYNIPTDSTPKYSVLMIGANHNFYNTVWTPGSYIAGTSDDWDDNYGSNASFCGSTSTSSRRLIPAEQIAALNTYAAAFFREYLGRDTLFRPILQVKDIIPPISSRLDTDAVFVSYHPPVTNRLDLNRIDTSIRTSINSLSDSVIQNGLLIATICGGGLTMPTCGISSFTAKEPHKGSTTIKGLAQMNMKWNNATDYYQNNIPLLRQNISKYGCLIYRAAVNYAEYTINVNLNYTIVLTDSFGISASVPISNYTKSMYLPRGTASGVLPKILFNTIRIPLIDFIGVDLTRIKNVKFLFNQSSAGAILISDLSFAGVADAPCENIIANFVYDTSGAYLVNFRDTSIINNLDSINWQWNFGDPLSGIANSSSIENPNHIFSDDGNYNVCMYLEVLRNNGANCKDTICKNINIQDLCPYVNASYSLDSSNAYLINFTDISSNHPTQTVSWQWNFGDTASGINNISSLQNPNHLYTDIGNYQTCIYISALQTNGTYCYDTFCSSINIPDQCSILDANFISDSSNIYEITFTNQSISNSSDIVSYLWNFGDTAINAIDSSILMNPIYNYSGPGNYEVCLYTESRTSRGFVCLDTFCSTIIIDDMNIDNTGVFNINNDKINIFPNPAKDYIFISGIKNQSNISLYSSIGELIFKDKIQYQLINLPSNISNGYYTLILESENQKVYKKIVIQK